jgi:hypothetical protein
LESGVPALRGKNPPDLEAGHLLYAYKHEYHIRTLQDSRTVLM